MQASVKQSCSSLQNILVAASAKGHTALGPAALAAVILAQKHKMGSNLVICTDGEANKGIGNFQAVDPESVYTKIGRIAAETGVAINLIAIVGQNCNVHALS